MCMPPAASRQKDPVHMLSSCSSALMARGLPDASPCVADGVRKRRAEEGICLEISTPHSFVKQNSYTCLVTCSAGFTDNIEAH